MKPLTIGLIAAMPEEIKPLLKLIGPYQKERTGSFNLYRFSVGTVEACLIESGLGPAKAEFAVQMLLTVANPSVIINFGFAGAITSGPAVGDLIMANRIFRQNSVLSEQFGLDNDLADRLAMVLSKECGAEPFQVHRGACISSGVIEDKGQLAGILPESITNPVLDMETAAVFQAAAKAGIPVISLRGISDDAEENLGFSLEEFTDEELNIKVGWVLLTVLRKPWLIPQLVRLAGNSRRAGRNLAIGIKIVLRSLSQTGAV